jgi:hypothetical protein
MAMSGPEVQGPGAHIRLAAREMVAMEWAKRWSRALISKQAPVRWQWLASGWRWGGAHRNINAPGP